MNKIQKTIVSMLVIALMTFSAGALLVQVHASGAANYSALPWANNSLVSPGTLNVWGSSTVGPIASEEIGEGNFVSYWNNLVSEHDTGANAWGTASALDLSSVNLETAGSGTAIPALAESTGAADIGEMSRPPTDAEFATASMTNMQQYAVGIDSVAIVVDPTMTWFPTQLNTLQVAQLFADSNPLGTKTNQGIQGATGATPLYASWGAFLDAYYGVSTLSAVQSAESAAGLTQISSTVYNAAINLAVRDPTSGTFDCFNNYFAVPNGYQFEYKSGSPSTVVGCEEMAPYTYCEQNINVYDTVSAGSPTTGDYIGFISLGYLESYGGPQPGSSSYPTGTTMIGINIAFNQQIVPASQTIDQTVGSYLGQYGGQNTNSVAGGSDYTSNPTVIINTASGDSGSGAAATASETGGVVTSITVTNPGSNYAKAPTVIIYPPGTTGTTAIATASISGVTGITIPNGGSGYTSAPTVTFSAAPSGGTTAAGTATITSGAVTSITITNTGSGYTSAPTISFSGGSGSGATATATISLGEVTAIYLSSKSYCPQAGLTTIAYYGDPGTIGETASTLDYTSTGAAYQIYQWSAYVKPTDANVIWAYSGKQGSQATGQYQAWRWLWEVVPGQIPSTGPLLAAGVWIAYMMADGTTVAGTQTTAGSLASSVGAGNSNFVEDQNYIPLERDDFTGASVIDSNLAPYTTLSTQTQSYPSGVVNFNDITYFVAQYINYQVYHIYNPYADEDANGVINFNDIALFVGNYIAYFTTYNPP